jgi:TRAP-type C4-dicarboxylate transport system permease large subunit
LDNTSGYFSEWFKGGLDVVRHDVMIGAAPFVLTLIVMIVLLILVPEIAMWLPNLGH